MTSPVTDEECAQIAALLKEGKSYAAITEATGRGRSTISRIAKEIGHVAGQSNAARAREARSAYSAERRAAIAAKATEEAELLLAQLHEPHKVYNFGGRDNTYNEEMHDEPPVDAKRAMVQSFRELMRTVLDIDRHDNKAEDGLAAVDQWLRDITGADQT